MQPTSQGSGKDVLIIDAEPAMLSIFDLALSDHGFTTHCTSSAERATEICHAVPLRIVLADVDFLGNAGLQLLASIKTLRPDARICLMSGGMPDYTAEDLKCLGVAEWFSKPFSLHQLAAVLEKQLQG